MNYSKSAFVLFLSMTLMISSLRAQQAYEAEIDLTAIKNDKLKVSVKLPSVNEKSASFIFPKIVPGTYDKADYGRFIEGFKAFDKKGRSLKVRKNDMNRYTIKKANKMASVSYRVNDSWDTPSENFIFQPAANNFEEGDEFVINSFGMFGYINGYTDDVPYQLNFTKPAGFYGASSLDKIESSATEDVFYAANYVELVDQPILYAMPDTASYFEDGARIGIAIHSPTDDITAELVRDWIRPVTKATSFVLGEIPTDEYWFIMHFFNWGDEVFRHGPPAFGALEHNKSSLYFLPTFLSDEGVDLESVKGNIDQMATHEFLHILSPLNLHSEEIAYFDFYDTKISKHLWLYEGVTEYLSMKSRLIGGLMDIEEFGAEVVQKMKMAGNFKEMSFTEMSENIIDPVMQKEYMNVYMKGALIAMALDIKIAEESNGENDLIKLVLGLIKDYGMEKPFKDDELFDVIAERTAPGIRTFFRDHVEGAEPLPLTDLLNVCGMEHKISQGDAKLSFGPIRMQYDAESGYLNVSHGGGEYHH